MNSKKTQVYPDVHKLCDFISDCGGVVELNTEDFNSFSDLVWDIWEAGYSFGQQQGR